MMLFVFVNNELEGTCVIPSTKKMLEKKRSAMLPRNAIVLVVVAVDRAEEVGFDFVDFDVRFERSKRIGMG